MEIIETNLNFGAMDTRAKTNRIILHHAEATSCSAEDIHRWHLSNGWSGAGYHFLVRKDGNIYRLRPENTVGAHAFGSNYDSIGICAEGKYNDETMPEVQKNSIIELVKYLVEKYNISTKQKHSDVCRTSCPGTNYPFVEIVNGQAVSVPIMQEATGDIADIQRELNSRYGLNISVDNIYGNETKGALVYALQKEIGANADKIFGPVTKAKCPNIATGGKSNIRWLIQAMLICHGFDITLDGIFGNETLTAVKEFQKRNGLSADGIVGKNTFAKLFR